MSSLGTKYLRRPLMVVLRDVATDFPVARFEQSGRKVDAPDRKDCNLSLLRATSKISSVLSWVNLSSATRSIVRFGI
jgi:hypothetical protein